MTKNNTTDVKLTSDFEQAEQLLYSHMEKKLVSAFLQNDISATVKCVIPSFQLVRFVCAVDTDARELCNSTLELLLSINMDADLRISYADRCEIYVDVERRNKHVLSFTDILDIDTEPENTFLKRMKYKLPALIGSTLDGKPLCIDIAAMPHLIVGGGTGSGKSTLLSCAILSLCAYRSPDEVRLLLADPKKIEFSAIGAFLPHLLHPIISDCQDVIAALKWLISETERRYDLLSAADVYLFDAYNKKVKDTERLYRIVFVIDEIADYMITDTEFDDLVMRLSQKARAVGIHLVLSTQRISHDVLTGAVKANIPARIALSCYSRNDSMNLFDEDGAERLMSNGDMLLRLPAVGDSVRAQGAFVSCAEVSAVLADIGKKYKKAEICKELAEYIEHTRETNRAVRTDMSDECKERVLEYIEDDTFLKAVDLTLKNRTVTSATLQRWLRIGYSKAVSYLDIMEDMGIIASTSKPRGRTALISAEEWNDIKESLLTFKKIGARGSRGEDEDIAPLDSADIPDFSTLFEGLDEDDGEDGGEDISPLDSADLPDFSALFESLEADDEEDGTDMPTSEPTPNVLNDDLFKLAVDAVFEDGKAVASLLQKRLFIGYIRAFNLIAAMHDFGIIGDTDTPGVYVPIISREAWLDILKKHNIT